MKRKEETGGMPLVWVNTGCYLKLALAPHVVLQVPAGMALDPRF